MSVRWLARDARTKDSHRFIEFVEINVDGRRARISGQPPLPIARLLKPPHIEPGTVGQCLNVEQRWERQGHVMLLLCSITMILIMIMIMIMMGKNKGRLESSHSPVWYPLKREGLNPFCLLLLWFLYIYVLQFNPFFVEHAKWVKTANFAGPVFRFRHKKKKKKKTRVSIFLR